MKHQALYLVLATVTIFGLAACQVDDCMQSPDSTDMSLMDQSDDSHDKGLIDPGSYLYTQVELADIYQNRMDVDLVSVTHNFNLQTGETYRFIPPRYPESEPTPSPYECIISVESGSVPDNAQSSCVDITLYVMDFDFIPPRSSHLCGVPVFLLQVDHPDGLELARPLKLKLPSHPMIEDCDESGELFVMFVERDVVNGKETYWVYDAQNAEIDTKDGRRVLQVSYLSEYGPDNGRPVRGGTWGGGMSGAGDDVDEDDDYPVDDDGTVYDPDNPPGP